MVVLMIEIKMGVGMEEIMPQAGEIKRGNEIGKKDKYRKYIWAQCIICNKGRWAELDKGKPRYQRCPKCVGTIVNVGERGSKQERHIVCWRGRCLQRLKLKLGGISEQKI